MKTRTGFNLLLLAFTLALSPALEAGKTVPYKGRAQGQVIETVHFAEPVVNGGPFTWERAEAVGNFTHVGRATTVLEWLCSVAIINDQLTVVLEGTFEMTSARGDRIFGVFKSAQLPGAEDYLIDVEVTGGTGKFHLASGVIPGGGSRKGDLFHYSLDGLITFHK